MDISTLGGGDMMGLRGAVLSIVIAMAVLTTGCGDRASRATDSQTSAAPLAGGVSAAPSGAGIVVADVALPVLPTSETPIDKADAWDDVWQALRNRPVLLPALAPGASCPVSRVTHVYKQNQGLGDGPIFPIYAENVLRFETNATVDGWHLAKVMWMSNPRYRGPALIRGHQIDGESALRFPVNSDLIATAELRFPIWTGVTSPEVAPEWRMRPSLIAISAPGCYGIQIDGLNFSRVLVFEART